MSPASTRGNTYIRIPENMAYSKRTYKVNTERKIFNKQLSASLFRKGMLRNAAGKGFTDFSQPDRHFLIPFQQHLIPTLMSER